MSKTKATGAKARKTVTNVIVHVIQIGRAHV